MRINLLAFETHERDKRGLHAHHQRARLLFLTCGDACICINSIRAQVSYIFSEYVFIPTSFSCTHTKYDMFHNRML